MGAAQTAVLPRGALLEEIVRFLNAERIERQRLATPQGSGVHVRATLATEVVRRIFVYYQHSAVCVDGVDLLGGSGEAREKEVWTREQYLLAVTIGDLADDPSSDVLRAVAVILDGFLRSLGNFRPRGAIVIPVLSPEYRRRGTQALAQMFVEWIEALTSCTAT